MVLVTGFLQSTTNAVANSQVRGNLEIRYARPEVADADGKTRGGWLMVRHEKIDQYNMNSGNNEKPLPDHNEAVHKEDINSLFFICEYTKLLMFKKEKGRAYFKILDGPHKNDIVSLAESNVEPYTDKNAPTETDIMITVKYPKSAQKEYYSMGQKLFYWQSMANLECGGLSYAVSLLTKGVKAKYTVIPEGTYNLLVPDTAHGRIYTEQYRVANQNVLYDQVWFPIEFGDNSRYLHLGNVSEGCVTVMGRNESMMAGNIKTIADIHLWIEIYEYLIQYRAPGNDTRTSKKQYIGKIKIEYTN